MRLGILTAGGDCSGLNAVIRAVVTRAVRTDDAHVLGIEHGWGCCRIAGVSSTSTGSSARGWASWPWSWRLVIHGVT